MPLNVYGIVPAENRRVTSIITANVIVAHSGNPNNKFVKDGSPTLDMPAKSAASIVEKIKVNICLLSPQFSNVFQGPHLLTYL